MDKRAQNKFLSGMYDDFFKLVTSDAIRNLTEKEKKIKYNKENIPKIDSIGTRAELLKRAKIREENQRKEKEEKLKEKNENEDYNSKDDSSNEEIQIEEGAIEELETEEEKKTRLDEFFSRVDESHLTEESKVVLKK